MIGQTRGHPLMLLAFIGLCAVCIAPTRANATHKESDSVEYRAVIDRAVAEFESGNYAEARGLFARAHEIYPNARTFRGLGLVAFELRNYAAAVQNLEAALASRERPLTDAQRASTEEALDKAQGFIGRVDLTTSPPNARVLVDGMAVEADAASIVLEVGDRVLDVQATGCAPDRRVLHIVGREQLKLQIALRRLVESEPNVQPGSRRDRDDTSSRPRHWYTSPWFWSGVAVVAAGAGAGLAVGLHHRAKTEAAGITPFPNMPMNGGGVLSALGSR